MFKKLLAGGLLLLAVCGYVFMIGPGEISPLSKPQSKMFPTLVGIDLEGKDFVLPDSFSKPLNLVVVAFERHQQKDVDTWIQVADDLITRHQDLAFFEVPLIYELKAPYRFWINNGMRAGIQDPKARQRTITVYTEREAFLAFMDMKTTSIYALLLTQKGEILWQAQGTATPENQKSLQAILKASY